MQDLYCELRVIHPRPSVENGTVQLSGHSHILREEHKIELFILRHLSLMFYSVTAV